MDEPKPFEEVYREYRERVYWFCLARVRDPAAAEDIANDVFVAAFRNYDKARPEAANLAVWLLTIAKNATTDHWRKQLRWTRLFSTLRAAKPAVSNAEEIAVVRDRLRGVLEVMQTLKPKDRTLIALRIGADLTYAQMAPIVGMSERAVTVATLRALERLRILLGASQ
jgi:RNA polymerase sigma-70 factor (ECF subfamily)